MPGPRGEHDRQELTITATADARPSMANQKHALCRYRVSEYLDAAKDLELPEHQFRWYCSPPTSNRHAGKAKQ